MQQWTTTTHHAFRYCRVRFDAFHLDNLSRNSCMSDVVYTIRYQKSCEEDADNRGPGYKAHNFFLDDTVGGTISYF